MSLHMPRKVSRNWGAVISHCNALTKRAGAYFVGGKHGTYKKGKNAKPQKP